MDQKNFSHEDVLVKQKDPLREVTPLSKYLALVLFVLLPFVGGYVGYTFAPEKVVEVKKTVYKDAEALNFETQTSDQQDTNYPARETAFVSYNENGWQGGWMVEKNKSTGEWENVVQVAGKFINEAGILLNEKVFLGTYGDVKNGSDWSTFVTIVSLENDEVSHIPSEGYLVNLLKVKDSIFAFIVNDGICLDSPGPIVDDDSGTCQGKIIDITQNGLSVLTFSELPGAKQLIAYDPITQTIILRDGYGDGGCVSSNFHTFDLVDRTITDSESYGGCIDEIHGDEMFSYDSYVEDIELFKQTVVDTYPHHIYSNESSGQSISVSSSKTKILEKDIELSEKYQVTNLTVE